MLERLKGFRMSSKNPMFNTPPVSVRWADIARPDNFKGALKHQIQVIVTPELQALLKEYAGDRKINGLRTDGDDQILKTKSMVYTREGKERFERVYDSQGTPTTENPFGGDTVSLRLSAAELDDNSMSFWLNAIQIIHKESQNGGGGGSPFNVIDGGYVAETATETPVAVADDDIPF
jgi:hypothetical protein